MNEWNEVVLQPFASRYQTLLQSLNSCINTTFELLTHKKKCFTFRYYKLATFLKKSDNDILELAV